jgi:uncharacterized Fe-S cluster-containing protein
MNRLTIRRAIPEDVEAVCRPFRKTVKIVDQLWSRQIRISEIILKIFSRGIKVNHIDLQNI